MKDWHRWLAVVGIVAPTIGCDRMTKNLAARRLASTSRHSFLADTFRLEYIENSGGFLGLGGDLPDWSRVVLFTMGGTTMLVGIAILLLRHRISPQPLVGLTLLWAGGASNLLDRIFWGTVIDFMSIGIGSFRTGVFNVADVAIMSGAVLLISSWRPIGKRRSRGG